MRLPRERSDLKLLIGVAVVAIVCLANPELRAQSRVTIHVRAETVVETDRVELGAVSSISGESELAGRLKKVSLGYSPGVGSVREIDRDQIALSIMAAGLLKTDFVLDAPERTKIRRASQVVSIDQIRSAAESALRKRLEDRPIEIRIAHIDVPKSVEVPVGKLELRADTSAIRDVFERFSLPVEIRVNDSRFLIISVSIEIEAYSSVLVMTNDLAANASVTARDVTLKRTKIDRSLTHYLFNLDALRGLKSLNAIRAGTPLTNDLLAPGIVVRFGDPVRIEARSGTVKFVVIGEARGSGRIGDRIAVRNVSSGAIIQAVVLDEGRVKVAI